MRWLFSFFCAFVPLFIFAEGSNEPAVTPPLPAENIPLPTPSVSYEGAFLKMILALVGLLLLVFISIWLLRRLKRRFGFSGHHKQITVLERHPLSQKSMLYLIEVRGKKVVIAESQLEIKKIATFDQAEEED